MAHIALWSREDSESLLKAIRGEMELACEEIDASDPNAQEIRKRFGEMSDVIQTLVVPAHAVLPQRRRKLEKLDRDLASRAAALASEVEALRREEEAAHKVALTAVSRKTRKRFRTAAAVYGNSSSDVETAKQLLAKDVHPRACHAIDTAEEFLEPAKKAAADAARVLRGVEDARTKGQRVCTEITRFLAEPPNRLRALVEGATEGDS